MSFPDDPTDLVVQARFGSWTDITADVLDRGLTITRGRANEGTQTDPSALAAQLDNAGGHYSPRNANSPYFGTLGLNAPIRAYLERGAQHLEILGSGSAASTPDSAAVSITGDLDVRIDATTASWPKRNLCGKFVTVGDQRSWSLAVESDGTLTYAWYTAGTTASGAGVRSTRAIPVYPGRQALRVTHDVDDGAGGNVVTFYTAATIDGPWTQLGDAVVRSGTASIFDSTAAVEVGQLSTLSIVNGFLSATATPALMQVHAFELRSGIDGTIVADPDFTAQAIGATAFTDAAGADWSLTGASITNRRWRFNGELSSLPTDWEVSGSDVYSSIQAGGLLRRLGQRIAPLQSSIRRGVLSEAATVAYWPCEDGADATTLAPALSPGKPLTIVGTPSLAASSAFAASAALPYVASTSWSGAVPSYAPTGESQMRFLLAIPSAGMPTGTVIARAYTTGSAARFEIVYTTGTNGSISFKAYDSDGTTLYGGTSTINDLNGSLLRISLELTQNGSDVDVIAWVQEVGSPSGAGPTKTLTGKTFDRISSVVINPARAALDEVTVGHISVHSQITSIDDLSDELVGWVGETAGARIERLCTEEGIAFVGIGAMTETAPMGVQRPATFGDLIRECVDADLGILFEPASLLAIGYRARTSMYNQPAIELDYAAGHLSGAPGPVDDDKDIRNDVIVSRSGGSSARHQVTTGPLSILEPPDGAGPYPDDKTINVYTDLQLRDQAGWRAHLGTVDESRYPKLVIDFTAQAIVADQDLTEQLLQAEAGDRITVANLPAWLPPEPIDQLMQGTSERFGNYVHGLTINTAPASPYRIAVYDADRYDTAGSQLAADSDTVTFADDASTPPAGGVEFVTVSVPAGTSDGDGMIALIGLIGQVAVTAPAGWDQIGTYQDAGTNTRFAAYSRVASSEPASYTWSWTGSFFKAGGWIGSYPGVDTSALVADFASTPASSGTQFMTGAVTAPAGGGFLITGVFERHPASGSATTWATSDADDVERLDSGTNAGSGQDVSIAVYDSGRMLDAGDHTRTLTASQALSQIATFAVMLAADPATLSVATTTGQVWTTDPADFPLDVGIGGEKITVTAISGTTSPQAFTCTRAVNGISKRHAAGTDVALWTPTYRGL